MSLTSQLEKEHIIPAPLGGLRLDVPSSLMDDRQSTNCWNMSMGESDLYTRPGFHQVGENLPFPNPVIHLTQVQDFQMEFHTLAFTTQDIYKLSSATQEWESILPEGVDWNPSTNLVVDTAFFTNRIIIVNGMDSPLEWELGAAEVAVIPGLSDIVPRQVVSFYSRLVFAHITENDNPVPQRVRWTAVGTYDDLDSGQASFVDLVDTPDPIIGVRPLGEGLAIYKSNSIILCSWIGGQSVFSFDTRITNNGLAAPRAVSTVGDHHIFLANDNVYRYSGGRSIEPIGDAVKSVMPRLVRDGSIDRSIASRYGSEIWFIVPIEGTNPDTTLVYNFVRDSWYVYNTEAVSLGQYQEHQDLTIGDLEGEIGDLVGRIGDYGGVSVRPRIAIGTKDGYILSHAPTDSTDNGEAIEAMWDSKDLVFGEHKTRYNRLRYVAFDAMGSSVDVYYSIDEGNNWVEIGSQELSDEFEWYKLHFDVTARQVRLRFHNDRKGEHFQLRVFKVGYREGARW